MAAKIIKIFNLDRGLINAPVLLWYPEICGYVEIDDEPYFVSFPQVINENGPEIVDFYRDGAFQFTNRFADVWDASLAGLLWSTCVMPGQPGRFEFVRHKR